jgi:glucose/arabinose dehydrogenase
MVSRVVKLLGACAVAFGSTGAVAVAAGPPLPTSTNGKPVQQVASGLLTTTSFAFGAGKVFAAEVSTNGPAPGGVFVLAGGTATRLAEGPPVAFGLAWRAGTLYVSAGDKLVTMSGWTGSKFTKVKVIYKAPKGFTGFNGLAFGANGRLYVGVDLGNTNDHSATKTPYAFDILSFKANGKGLKVVATGLRQPWQFAFPKGSSSPFVSNLGQDLPKNTKAQDYIVRVKQGQAYGFPGCNWVKVTVCKGFAKPVKFFKAHTDPMGLVIVGNQLYFTEFGGSTPPRVVSMPLTGGATTVRMKGFGAPIVGLGSHAGYLYVGDVAGDVYRVKL